MSSPSKRICCLLCVYNDQAGLERSLVSVFEDEPLADILIVDDGSSPACTLPPIPAEFDVQLLRIESNVGLVAALNFGLECILDAHYTYVARLDAGDTVNPGRLKAQAEYLDRHPEIGLLGTQMLAFDQATGQPLFEFNNPHDTATVERSLKVRNCIAHPSAMIRAEVFRSEGCYDPAYKYAEDYEMWRRIARHYAVANLPIVYVNKAITPTQMTAVYRSGCSLSKLKTQLRYFEPCDPWCWIGVARTLFALFIPRWILLNWHTKAARKRNMRNEGTEKQEATLRGSGTRVEFRP